MRAGPCLLALLRSDNQLRPMSSACRAPTIVTVTVLATFLTLPSLLNIEVFDGNGAGRSPVSSARSAPLLPPPAMFATLLTFPGLLDMLGRMILLGNFSPVLGTGFAPALLLLSAALVVILASPGLLAPSEIGRIELLALRTRTSRAGSALILAALMSDPLELRHHLHLDLDTRRGGL